MILETTNPKYQQPPLLPAHAKRYVTTPERSDGELMREGLRDWPKGRIETERFKGGLRTRSPALDPVYAGHTSWHVSDVYQEVPIDL